MTKEEFLKKLEQQLNLINDEERKMCIRDRFQEHPENEEEKDDAQRFDE